MRSVYLDHQSSTPVLPEVFEAMRPYFTEFFGNPSSHHQQGLRARDALASARAQVAELIHAESPEEIIFTSDGTESANLAIKGVAYANQRKGNHLIVSQTEHPSVLNSVEFLQKQGFSCTRVKVDSQGGVDVGEIAAAITEKTILIAIHHANHDIGTIQPIAEIAALAGERGIAFYADAEASTGWVPLDVRKLGVNLLSFSPHRFYGPKGVGILYRNRNARMMGILHGGMQENGRRAGIENIPGIVGAGVAAHLANRDLASRSSHVARLQEKLWGEMKRKIPNIRLNGPEPGAKRVPTNLNIAFELIEGEGLMLACDMSGIAIASGSSCLSKTLKSSYVLDAIGLDPELARGSVILSLGKENMLADIDYTVETFSKIVEKLRVMSPLWDEFKKGSIGSALNRGATV